MRTAWNKHGDATIYLTVKDVECLIKTIPGPKPCMVHVSKNSKTNEVTPTTCIIVVATEEEADNGEPITEGVMFTEKHIETIAKMYKES